jgi:hypothetical protein
MLNNDMYVEENMSNEIIEGSRRKFEPIIGCKHPIIASGATPIGSVDHASDEQIIRRASIFCRLKKMVKDKEILSLYSNKNSIIASGATPIRSAGCAPDELQ